MPRGKTGPEISNLSITIPRSVHRSARVKAIRSAAPSFASYVAAVLATAPEALTATQQLHARMIEQELKGGPIQGDAGLGNQ